MKFTLDTKTYEAIRDVTALSGDDLGVQEGENDLPLEKARLVWFTLMVLCDPKGPPIDAAPGSTEAFFGFLRSHPPAKNLLTGDLAKAKPGLDLISPIMDEHAKMH